MIEVVEFKGDVDVPTVRLGCGCGDPRLAAYQCDRDQIIYCTHCGEITSRERLRNEVTLANQVGDWKWENVVDRAECPMVNVSLPVHVFVQGKEALQGGRIVGHVTKLSTDHCFLRLDNPTDALVALFARRGGLTLELSSDEPPLLEQTDCTLEEAVHPVGEDGPIYYNLRINPHSSHQVAELKEFYQAICGLRFDSQVLLYAAPEHCSHLRRMLVDCLPMARVEVAIVDEDFMRMFREKSYHLLILPTSPETMQLVQHAVRLSNRPAPRIIALLSQRSAEAISSALRWGATDVLAVDCEMGEMRHCLQHCLDDATPVAVESSRAISRLSRRDGARASSRMTVGVTVVSPSDEETMQLLLMSSQTHDPHTSNHLKRIASYCAAIAKCLGWNNDRVAQLATASKLHDVGKIGVPDEILRKTGALTEDERKVMQQHARFGFRVLQAAGSNLMRLAAVIALRHHERYDGKGYPDGLAGDAIPVESQVVSVADVFDALTTARPYKPPWSNEKAFEFLAENRGKMFAPPIVDAFFKALPDVLRSQQAFLDDFRDIWTERRKHPRFPLAPISISLELAVPEQTFRPYRLVGHLTNVSEGGVRVKISNVSGDLFAILVMMRRYGKLYCDDAEWQGLNNVACGVIWIDYYAVPDPNACNMGLSFHRERPDLQKALARLAEAAPDHGASNECIAVAAAS